MLFLLEHLPPNLHLILSTRIDPPWPLARFRARNQLVEVRTRDLRVIGLVIGSIVLTLAVIAIPLFQELLRVNWLNSLTDYGLVILAMGIWALTLRTIWRLNLVGQFQ